MTVSDDLVSQRVAQEKYLIDSIDCLSFPVTVSASGGQTQSLTPTVVRVLAGRVGRPDFKRVMSGALLDSLATNSIKFAWAVDPLTGIDAWRRTGTTTPIFYPLSAGSHNMDYAFRSVTIVNVKSSPSK